MGSVLLQGWAPKLWFQKNYMARHPLAINTLSMTETELRNRQSDLRLLPGKSRSFQTKLTLLGEFLKLHLRFCKHSPLQSQIMGFRHRPRGRNQVSRRFANQGMPQIIFDSTFPYSF